MTTTDAPTPAQLVDVAGVRLPAADLAHALRDYATARVMADRRRPRGAPAFRSEPWTEAVRRLESSAIAELRAPGWTPPAWLSCAEYAERIGRQTSTVRGWATTGRFGGAARRAGRNWIIRADAEPPTRQRRTGT